METLELIDQLEDLIVASASIPLMGKSLMDKDELLDSIKKFNTRERSYGKN